MNLELKQGQQKSKVVATNPNKKTITKLVEQLDWQATTAVILKVNDGLLLEISGTPHHGFTARYLHDGLETFADPPPQSVTDVLAMLHAFAPTAAAEADGRDEAAFADLLSFGLTLNHESRHNHHDTHHPHTSVYHWTLPQQVDIQANFGPEKLQHKVIKILRREIQTGHEIFDDVVYIATNTKKATETFLQNAEVRRIIYNIVQLDGSITIDHRQVRFLTHGETKSKAEPNKAEMARFLRVLLRI
ncbi:MAG TPA: hypothetical protein VLL52_03565 [Anaerolineae bacterium]|nr:hypothetical protein [Anaerolineae bacterium]